MNLEYSEEQRLLRDSAVRFVAKQHDFDTFKRIAGSARRCSDGLWAEMARMGWLGLSLPEADGGSGGDAVDVGILMEVFGDGLVLEPFISTVVLAGRIITRAGTVAQREHWVGRIAAGETRLAVVGAELDGAASPVRAVRLPRGGWRLDGTVRWVVDAPAASDLLVVAAAADAARPGAVAFLLARDTPGIRAVNHERVDARLGASITFERVEVPDGARLGATGAGQADPAGDGIGAGIADIVADAFDRATVAACGEAIGCIRNLLDRTVDYSRTRVQFGQPLAANQALRHRMVDMAMQTEEARAIALRASLMLDREPGERARAVSGAKLRVARAARFVSEGAIQIHGAMGVTDELSVGAYVKRLIAFEMSHGTAPAHQRRLMELRRAEGGPQAFSRRAA